MLISEYFKSGVKQRSAAFRIYSYLADKDVDYRVYYNIGSLEEKLTEDKEMPNIPDPDSLKRYYSLGFFKDDRYVIVRLEGKLREYKDIHADNVDYADKNFIDESIALSSQDKYLELLSEYIQKEFEKIQHDKKLVDKR